MLVPVRLAIAAMIAANRWLDDAPPVGLRQRVAVVAGVREQGDRLVGGLARLAAEMTRDRVPHQRAQGVFVHHSSS